MELLKITEQDRQLFEKYKPLNETIRTGGFVRNYTAEAYTHLIYLYSRYISPSHTFTHWCSDCRFQLVQQLYLWYEKQNYEMTTQEQDKDVSVLNDIEIDAPIKKRGRKKKTDGQ